MKKNYLIICALIGFGFYAHAQTVLQSTDVMYDATMNMVFVGYSEPGPGGENISWDFSDAIIMEDATDFSFDAPLASDFIDYPDANIRFNWPQGSRLFKHTDQETLVLGHYTDASQLVYDDPLVYYQFPVAYSNSFTDDYSGTNTNTMGEAVNTSGIFNFSVDGYGTLLLPSGTYENVLRIKREYNNTLTGMDFMVETTEIDYEWYHPDYPVALFAMNSLTITATGAVVAESGVMMNLENVGIEESSTSLATLYPNPANDIFYIAVEDVNAKVSLAVYDMLGRVVLQQENEVIEGGKLKIDAGNWEKGSYIINLQQGDKSWHNKLSLL